MKNAESSAFEIATAEFHQALRTNDAEALFAYVADDVLLMPPGEVAVRGKNAMRDWYAAFLSQYSTSSLTLSDCEVFVGDRWAVELGSYEWGLTPAAGGGDLSDRGSYMQLWKSQSDGQWRFEREIWMGPMDLAAALSVIQMDYLEMPGLRLTPQQGRRLWTLPLDLCQAALDTLVATGFLAKTDDGQYLYRGAAPVRIEIIDPLTWTTGHRAA